MTKTTRTELVMKAAASCYHAAVGCAELDVGEAWDDADEGTRDEYIRIARASVALVLAATQPELPVGPCLCPSAGLAHDAIIGTRTNQMCRRCGGDV